VEDRIAIEDVGEIASVDGVDLIAVGPTDLAQALGLETSDPLYSQAIENISDKIRKTGKAKMAFPLNLPAYPLGVSALKRLGVAYANCGPADISRLMDSYQQQVNEIRLT
jgi:2-keto-3-deoxy-L-rhamnonate aldolase RhmA